MLERARELLGKRWESRWPAWLALVLVGALSFSAGRFSGPVEVETRTEVVTATKWASSDHSRRNVVRTVYVERTPTDAGVVERISTREVESTESERTASGSSSASSSTVTREAKLPDWRVGLLVGGTWKEPALRLGDTPLVIGASVERRIVGGVSVGVWGTTQGAVGASVSGSF